MGEGGLTDRAASRNLNLDNGFAPSSASAVLPRARPAKEDKGPAYVVLLKR
jgi:hypothetical protein